MKRSAQVFFTQTKPTAPTSGFEAGCLVIFSLPFLAAGLFVMSLGLSSLILYYRAARWEPVPATIQSAELRESRGSKGSISYSITAAYRYEWEGRSFTGTQVGLERYKTSDRAHVRRYNELHAAQLQNRPVTVLVNPDNPDEALIYREMTTTSLMTIPFGLVFSLVGGALGVGSLWGWRKERTRRDRQQRDPDRPWTHEDLWPSFAAKSASVSRVFGLWVITSIAVSFTGLMFTAVVTSPNAHIVPMVIIGVLFAAALGLLGFTLYVTAAYLKYGRSRLLFPQMPLVPGDAYDCALILNRTLAGSAPLVLTVRCVESMTTGTGKNRKTVRTNVFESKSELPRAMIDTSDRRIPLLVEIPTGFPHRTYQGNPTHSWQLEVTAEEPGVDLKAVFELPVFPVASNSLIQQRSSLVMG